jgi:hypothetical protein
MYLEAFTPPSSIGKTISVTAKVIDIYSQILNSSLFIENMLLLPQFSSLQTLLKSKILL